MIDVDDVKRQLKEYLGEYWNVWFQHPALALKEELTIVGEEGDRGLEYRIHSDSNTHLSAASKTTVEMAVAVRAAAIEKLKVRDDLRVGDRLQAHLDQVAAQRGVDALFSRFHYVRGSVYPIKLAGMLGLKVSYGRSGSSMVLYLITKDPPYLITDNAFVNHLRVPLSSLPDLLLQHFLTKAGGT